MVSAAISPVVSGLADLQPIDIWSNKIIGDIPHEMEEERKETIMTALGNLIKALSPVNDNEPEPDSQSNAQAA